MTDMPPGAAIRLRAIAKSFPARSGRTAGAGAARHDVLTDVTLEVGRGEIIGLVGANGAGKTTLLEILATTQLPTAGDGFVGGCNLVSQAQQVRHLVGYAPAGTDGFYARLTGRANLEFFAALNNLSPAAARRRTGEVLRLIGALELEDAVVQRLSTGMRQKLGLARALLADPPILLLDEPARSLDPASQDAFHALLRRSLAAKMGKTVLMVTHDLGTARALCDRVALLRGGTIAGLWNAADLPASIRFDAEPAADEASR